MPAVLKKVLANSAEIQVGQIMMVNWSKLNPGMSFQPHYHEDMQGLFIVLAGQGVFNVAGKSVPIEPGDCVIVDPREIHSMHNPTENALLFLVIGIASGEDGKTVMVETV